MVQASYFDGRSTRVRGVDLSMADGDLRIVGDEIDIRVAFDRIRVDERLGRAPRRLRFDDGTFCEVRDLEALDTMLSGAGHRDGWVDRLQRHSRWVLLATIICAAVIGAGYQWGLPLAAAAAAGRLPPVVGKTLSVQTLKILEGRLLLPSKLPLSRQQTLLAKFRALHLPEGGAPTSEVLFRASPQLGSNAFTLPDGTIIVLDPLIESLDDDAQILAVFAHELGHGHGHHSLQLLLQTSAVGAFWALYVGDTSSLLAAAPAALIQAKYSQALELESDAYGAALLAKNGMSPGLLADALDKISRSHGETSQGGYLSTHPSTTERVRRLRGFTTDGATSSR